MNEITATWSVHGCDPDCIEYAWPSHDGLEVVGASREEIRATVLDKLDTAANACDRSSGWDVGDRVYAMITYADGTEDIVSIELTADHLVEPPEEPARPEPDKRRVDDEAGDWRRFDPERDAYTRG